MPSPCVSPSCQCGLTKLSGDKNNIQVDKIEKSNIYKHTTIDRKLEHIKDKQRKPQNIM